MRRGLRLEGGMNAFATGSITFRSFSFADFASVPVRSSDSPLWTETSLFQILQCGTALFSSGPALRVVGLLAFRRISV